MGILGVVIGIALIVIGLFSTTTVGAAWGLRQNSKWWNSGQGYRAKTITGQRAMGVFAALIGVAFLVGSV